MAEQAEMMYRHIREMIDLGSYLHTDIPSWQLHGLSKEGQECLRNNETEKTSQVCWLRRRNTEIIRVNQANTYLNYMYQEYCQRQGSKTVQVINTVDTDTTISISTRPLYLWVTHGTHISPPCSGEDLVESRKSRCLQEGGAAVGLLAHDTLALTHQHCHTTAVCYKTGE